METDLNTHTDITYRQYQDGDEKAIIPLFNLVFNRVMPNEIWNWAYKENPQRRLDITLAFERNQLVGQSAGVPLQFSFHQQAVKVSRVQNVMVHPDCRGKGVFTATLKKLTEYIFQQNLDLVVTFPNDNSLPTFIQKLDYQHIADIVTFSLPVSAFVPETPAESSDFSVSIEDKISFTDSDHDFMLLCLKQYAIFNTRELDYLDWRFNQKSEKKYKVLRAFRDNHQIAFIVFKLYPEANSVDLVEFFLEEGSIQISHLLKAIVSFYKKKDEVVDSFNIWLFPHYTFYQAFIESGFFPSKSVTHVVTKSFSLKTQAGFDDCRSYYLSMGDSDVY